MDFSRSCFSHKVDRQKKAQLLRQSEKSLKAVQNNFQADSFILDTKMKGLGLILLSGLTLFSLGPWTGAATSGDLRIPS